MQRLRSIAWLALLTVATAGLVSLSAMAARELVDGYTEGALIKFSVAIYLGWVATTALRHVRSVVVWVAACFGYVREDNHPDLL